MNLVLLNNVDHQDFRVRPPAGPEGGAETIQVLAFATEFEDLQRHFPIVFRRSAEGAVRPVAILGLAENENLFTDDAGRWRSEIYVPASVQRGPFALARADDEAVVPRVLIDLDHPSLSREKGEKLFLARGGNSRFLDRMIGVLGTIFSGEQQADALVAALEAAGVLHPVNLQVRTSEDEIYAISDVQIVRSASLETLPDSELLALHRAGFLTHAIHAASSLGNLQRLADLKASRSRANCP